MNGITTCFKCGREPAMGGVFKHQFYCLKHFNEKLLERGKCPTCKKKRELSLVDHRAVCATCAGNRRG